MNGRKALYGLLVAIMGALWMYGTADAIEAYPKGYENAARGVPAHQWAWVTKVDLVDRNDYGATYQDRRIELSRKADGSILTHEVGHVVAIMRPDLEAEYCSRYRGTMRDCHERFAEAYRYVIEGRKMDADEARYMRDHVLTATERMVTIEGSIVSTVAPAAYNPCGSIVQGEIVAGCTGLPR